MAKGRPWQTQAYTYNSRNRLKKLENIIIIGICIIHQEETPGLGGRMAEKEFLNPFRNKKMSPRIIAVRPG